MVDETQTTDEEGREAEALAHALERDGSSPEMPEDALEAAALLRYSADTEGLDAQRKAEILQDVLSSAEGRVRQPARRGFNWRRWLLPAGGLAGAAAAAALVFMSGQPLRIPAATELPAPSSALLAAQVEAVQGDRHAVADLAGQMQDYRRDMYLALNQRYSGVE